MSANELTDPGELAGVAIVDMLEQRMDAMGLEPQQALAACLSAFSNLAVALTKKGTAPDYAADRFAHMARNAYLSAWTGSHESQGTV
jgi:hypothetical protein